MLCFTFLFLELIFYRSKIVDLSLIFKIGIIGEMTKFINNRGRDNFLFNNL
jgi:uncharacterized protein with HEPN domain